LAVGDKLNVFTSGEYGHLLSWDFSKSFKKPSSETWLPTSLKTPLKLGYLPTKNQLCVLFSDGSTSLISLQEKQSLESGKGHIKGSALAASAKGEVWLTGGADRLVKVWSLSGVLLQTLEKHVAPITALAISHDGRLAISGDLNGNIVLWDTKSWKAIHEFEAHPFSILSLGFGADDRTFFTGSSDSSMKIWDTQTHQLIHSNFGHTSFGFETVALAADGKLLATGSADKTILLWDYSSGAQQGELIGHTGTITGIVFFADGKRIATSGLDGTIGVWDATSKTLKGFLLGHEAGITDLAYIAPNSLVSASEDKTIRFWDLGTMACIGTIYTDGKSYLAQNDSGNEWFGPDAEWMYEVTDSLALVKIIPLSDSRFKAKIVGDLLKNELSKKK
jgi:WD40 repeat protein